MSSVGDHAVVLGGSMAGLCSARVLSDCFDRVTVIERDVMEDGPEARRGVPQANHLHVLLEAGRSTLEDLFPGFGEKILSEGGLLLDATKDVGFFAEGGYFTGSQQRITAYSASRPLFEFVVRDLLEGVPGVRIRTGCQFTDYRIDDDHVTGVEFISGDGSRERLEADLVVDATGRTSRTPNWLEEHGYTPPPVDEVRINVSYSTRYVERPPDDRRAFIVFPSPGNKRTGAVFPVEDDRWIMTLVGIHDEDPPTDTRGYLDYAASLPIPELKQILDNHHFASEEVVHYPFPSNLRRRYEDIQRFPGNLVVLGDAIASFNPIYGQGMSVAALEAVQLHNTLSAGGTEDVGMRFFDRAKHTVDSAWNLAVGGDHRFPETTGPKPRGTDLVNRYVSRLQRKAHTDSAVFNEFMKVQGLEVPPAALMRPSVLWRVLRPSV